MMEKRDYYQEARAQIIQQAKEQYGFDDDQATRLADSVQGVTQALLMGIDQAWETVKAALTAFAKQPGMAELLRQHVTIGRQSGKTDANLEALKQQRQLAEHRYARPRLPSQQGYNRTEYDRWRNRLGRGRGKRKR